MRLSELVKEYRQPQEDGCWRVVLDPRLPIAASSTSPSAASSAGRGWGWRETLPSLRG